MDKLNTKIFIKLINYGSSISDKNPWLAQEIMTKGIKYYPNEGIGYYNLGIALHMQRRPKAAIRAYKTSLRNKGCPYQSVKKNLAQDLLLSGNYQDGWNEYEFRFKENEHNFFKYHFGEAWDRISKYQAATKDLLLVSEQGYGDTIQFYRFAILLEKLGFNIILFCQKPLTKLLQESRNNIRIINELSDNQIKYISKWSPLLSLPMKLGITKENIPYPGAYIKANLQKITEWKVKLKQKYNHKLIGLHWQGNTEFEKKLYGKGRSMHFSNLMQLINLKNTEFVSLQKGLAINQLKMNNHLNFVRGQSDLNNNKDFSDTAAVIALCDLVITTDSVIAHLSGAMGIETWVALSWIPEWRWGLEGERTNWYPSIKLFRQPSQGDWSSVIKKINIELKRLR